MSCGQYQRDVTLWVGGELPARRAARIEAHLAGCGECRALADEVRRAQALVASRLDALVDDRELAAVRAGVTSRIRGATRATPPVHVRWRYALAVGGLAVVVALGALLGRRAQQSPVIHTAETVRPTPTAAPPRVAVPALGEVPVRDVEDGARVAATPSTRRPLVRGARSRALRRETTTQGEPLVVKLVTDDPNVVIYWLVDQKKG